MSGTWCSGITSASHAEGPGFNPQCVQFQLQAVDEEGAASNAVERTNKKLKQLLSQYSVGCPRDGDYSLYLAEFMWRKGQLSTAADIPERSWRAFAMWRLLASIELVVPAVEGELFAISPNDPAFKLWNFLQVAVRIPHGTRVAGSSAAIVPSMEKAQVRRDYAAMNWQVPFELVKTVFGS